MSLAATQAVFFAAVTARHPPSPGWPALGLIAEGPGLDAAGRLAVYRHAYGARLIGALRELFPLLAAALGDGFEPAAADFLAAHPPRERSLFHIGAGFPAAFEGRARALAELDHARREVFDAADDPPLTAAALQATPPEAWPGLRLRRVGPSRRLLDGGDGSPTLVWRVGDTAELRHRALSPLEDALVQALDAGGTLGELIDALSAAEPAGPGLLPALSQIFAVAAHEGWLTLAPEPAG